MSVLKFTSGRGNPAVEARIRHALAELRPLLRIEECGLHLVEFDAAAGVAVLRIEGGCPDCEMPAVTYLEGIAAHLRLRIPEVREVRALSADTDHHG